MLNKVSSMNPRLFTVIALYNTSSQTGTNHPQNGVTHTSSEV